MLHDLDFYLNRVSCELEHHSSNRKLKADLRLEKVDRLYRLDSFEYLEDDDGDEGSEELFMVARMEYKNDNHVFVELGGSRDLPPLSRSKRYRCRESEGYTYVFTDPQVMAESSYYKRSSMYAPHDLSQLCSGLREDGYEIQDWWKNAPTLKFLCHKALYENKKMLRHVREQEGVPTTIKTGLEEFIRQRREIRTLKSLRKFKNIQY